MEYSNIQNFKEKKGILLFPEENVNTPLRGTNQAGTELSAVIDDARKQRGCTYKVSPQGKKV